MATGGVHVIRCAPSAKTAALVTHTTTSNRATRWPCDEAEPDWSGPSTSACCDASRRSTMAAAIPPMVTAATIDQRRAAATVTAAPAIAVAKPPREEAR